MQIGLLGSGVVAQTLGRGWARHGHQIHLGTSDPARPELRAWSEETGQTVTGFADAARAGRAGGPGSAGQDRRPCSWRATRTPRRR
ncbi:NAD(P)-binding domain-containing protein [Actinomycetospora sp.]|uniref:NAD(P)-binding domain-containing protein n=1 Tax=Actinomycetospora sp. TaxID=1872135 RepID=UPI0039C8B956